MNQNDQNFIVQKIRTQYMDKQPSELDKLRVLDAKVKRPANVFAYVFGSVGAINMGNGMILVITDIGPSFGLADAMVPGIIIGAAGMAMAILNYPIYKSILASRRKKYADRILALSEKLMVK